MNIKNSVIIPAITLLFLAGTAMAEGQSNQPAESARFLQTDESADFAAYEFDEVTTTQKAETSTNKKAGGSNESYEWTPDYWTDIQ